MRYLLDTNICVYLINHRPHHEVVLRHMDGMAYGDILISAITIAEMRYGVANSAIPAQFADHDRALHQAAGISESDTVAVKLS